MEELKHFEQGKLYIHVAAEKNYTVRATNNNHSGVIETSELSHRVPGVFEADLIVRFFKLVDETPTELSFKLLR